MIKAVGAVLIIICGAAFGLSKALALETRTAYLYDMVQFISFLHTDLCYKQSESATALKKASYGLKRLPLDLSALDGKSLARCVEAAYERLPTEAKNEVFKTALLQYGTGETQAQKKHLEYAQTLLKNEADAAKEKLAADKKLYGALGIFGGIVAAILLI